MSKHSRKGALLGGGALLALLVTAAPTAATAAPNPPATTNATQGQQTTVRFSPGIPGRSAQLIVDAPSATRLVGVDDSACSTNSEGSRITCSRSQWVNPRTITLVVDEDAQLGSDSTGGMVSFVDGGTTIASAPFGIHVIAKPLVATVVTDVAGRSATVSGTAQPGAIVRVTGAPDAVDTEVPSTGIWSLVVDDLRTGTTALTVTQSVDGVPDQVLERAATIPTADPTVRATADAVGRAVVVSGTGEPEATISVSGPAGSGTTEVLDDGTWHVELGDVPWGTHEVRATQTYDSDVKTATTQITIEPAELTVELGSTDPETGSAQLVGTGHPRASIEVVTPAGTVTTEVLTDGTWSARAEGLQAGENTVAITQRVPGAQPTNVDFTIVIADTPLMHPVAAGGAGVAALVLLGAAIVRRMRSGRGTSGNAPGRCSVHPE